MSLDANLERLAAQYRAEGYEVAVRPATDLLPPFAADFAPDLLATRGNERVLVRVKRDRAELEADATTARQAELTNAQPGWRYDVVVLGPNRPSRGAEPTLEQIEQLLGEADTATQAGTPRAGFVIAWAGLEAAMRRAAQRAGVGGEIGTQPPTLIRELYSAGRLSPDEFRRLDATRHLRNEIVHGLASTAVDPNAVRSVIESARRILADSEGASTAG
jgi:hypothetical protein